MAGNDYIFPKSMESSEFAVPDSGKDNIDPESHKKIGGRRNADLYRHLVITGEYSEGQDGEQDTNYDEDNASVAGSCILQARKSQSSSHPASFRATLLANEEALERRFDARYDDPESSHLNFNSDIKTELPDQLAVNCADEGIDTYSRSLIDQVYAYVFNSPTSLAK